MRDGLAEIASEGITEVELVRTQGNIAGATALALEGTDSRMMRLGRSELVTGEFIDRNETLRRLMAVTLDDVQALARELASSPMSQTAVGPVNESLFDSL
jgi:predicted Zn-dependent peptidase